MISFSSLFRRRGDGCRPDRVDDRDLPLGAMLLSPPPNSASLRHLGAVRARDQLGSQSCTGQAVSQALRVAYLHQGCECPELSALAPYYWGRALWGGQNTDGGSYLRHTVRAVVKLGCPDEKAWPFSMLKVNNAPATSAVFSAAQRRGTRNYYRCYGVDDMRRAIANGFPIVGGWPIDSAFKNDNGSTLVDAVIGPTTGRHAMVLDEYNSDGTFGLLNSWGTDWRADGRAVATEAFAAQAFDAWAIDVRT